MLYLQNRRYIFVTNWVKSNEQDAILGVLQKNSPSLNTYHHQNVRYRNKLENSISTLFASDKEIIAK